MSRRAHKSPMDLYASLSSQHELQPIVSIEMHTAGEPTRIVIKGFPSLIGNTLLEKRAYAKLHHDSVRKRLMNEPRGHFDMYGAIIVQDTELVQAGKADIGVLFCHNEGFSTMCGHATIALGRFLIDTHDTSTFPRRNHPMDVDKDNRVISLTLHAPCGLVHVSVPIVFTEPMPFATIGKSIKSDPSRPVSFLSVPSFATGIDICDEIPNAYIWKELSTSTTKKVRFDIAFGGAFYAIVTVDQLGFPSDIPIFDALQRGMYTLPSLKEATRLFKAFLVETPEFRHYLRHPTSTELEYLYGIIVVDPPACNQNQSNTCICFFADQQVDRSPCGSGVCARTALAISKGELSLHDTWTYDSLVTKTQVEDAFVGRALKEVTVDHDERYFKKPAPWTAYIVEVSGYAYYTGTSTFVLERNDRIGEEGFVIQ